MGLELTVFVALLAALAIWLSIERLALQRALDSIPVRILVNGSRGKSSVTRLVAGALRQSGRVTLARTTGSAARIILPDGSEERIARRGRARVNEVIATIRRAARLGADAVVVECMAIRPELERALAERIVRPTITVITNVREDHLDVAGPGLVDVARAFAATAPRSGLVVASDGPFADLLGQEAARRGSRFLRVPPPGGAGGAGAAGAAGGRPFGDNASQALAVAASLGIPEGTALAGMRSAEVDPGAFRLCRVAAAGAAGYVAASAFAANDPTSTAFIIDSLRAAGQLPGQLAGVYNHRRDRIPRAMQFAAWLAAGYRSGSFSAIVMIGDRCRPFLRRLRRAGVPAASLVDASGIRDPRRLAEVVGRAAPAGGSVVGMGNIAGVGLALSRLWQRSGSDR